MTNHKDKTSAHKHSQTEVTAADRCVVVDLRLPFSGDQAEAQCRSIICPQFAKLMADSVPMPSVQWIQEGADMHLSRSILVRLKLKAHNGEQINVLCSAEEINSTGMFLMLPCQLGIDPGSIIEMELFLEEDCESASMTGKARKIAQIGDEDSVKYVLEVDFKKMSGLAERQIEAFIQSAQMNDHRQMLA